MAQITEVEQLRYDLSAMEESFNSAVAMLKREDEGWSKLHGREVDVEGPNLAQLKETSEHARLMSVANPLITHAVDLRQAYVWSEPPIIPGSAVEKERPGRKSKIALFVNKPQNLRALFNTDAHEQMEASVITDACYLLLGNVSSKELRPVPLREITEVQTHVDFTDEIVAYKRTWTSYRNGTPEEMVRWYYVESVPKELRADRIGPVGADSEVDHTYEMLDFWVNKQVGWTFGVPDALAALPWARDYVSLMNTGMDMTEALARFVGKMTNKTKAGQQRVGATLSKKGAGQLAGLADGNSMEIFASAGKTYNFEGIRPYAAMVAAAMQVSLEHLLSGTTGAAAAAGLDTPTRRSVKQRQDSWALFIQRVLKWGTKEDVEVSFPQPDEQDQYRAMQAALLPWQHGLVHADEVRPRVLSIANIEMLHDKAPEGVLVPNNEHSVSGGAPETGMTVAAPDQGQSNGTGGVDSTTANDLRTDTLT